MHVATLRVFTSIPLLLGLTACGAEEPDRALGRHLEASKGMPVREAGVYADGVGWGTRFTTELPAPRGNNAGSYDGLYVITNSNHPETQLPVSEAGPGNPAYNGGRWEVYTATWTEMAFDEFGEVPLLMSFEELSSLADGGYLEVELGSPDGGPPPYFQCPLLKI